MREAVIMCRRVERTEHRVETRVWACIVVEAQSLDDAYERAVKARPELADAGTQVTLAWAEWVEGP